MKIFQRNAVLELLKDKFIFLRGKHKEIGEIIEDIAYEQSVINKAHKINIERNLCHLSLSAYPTRKAYRQILPDILQVKAKISKFFSYQTAFSERFQEVEIAYKSRKYSRAINLVHHRSIQINNQLFTLCEITIILDSLSLEIEEEFLSIYLKKQDLEQLAQIGKIFAQEFSCVSNNYNYLVHQKKKKVLDDVSLLYQQNYYYDTVLIFEQFVKQISLIKYLNNNQDIS